MTASAETVKPLPSTFALLGDALRTTHRHKGDLYGFAAWLLFPLLLYVAAHASGAVGEQILSTLGDVGIVLLSTWITAATILTTAFAIAHPDKQPDPRSIGAHAWSALLALLFAQILVGVLQLAGFIAFFVPGLVITVFLAFTGQEVVLHGHAGFKALTASRERVRGLFWPILRRLFGISAAFFILLSGALITIGMLAGGVAEGDLITSLTTNAPPLWFDILANILQICLLPPFLVAHTLLYLSITKE